MLQFWLLNNCLPAYLTRWARYLLMLAVKFLYSIVILHFKVFPSTFTFRWACWFTNPSVTDQHGSLSLNSVHLLIESNWLMNPLTPLVISYTQDLWVLQLLLRQRSVNIQAPGTNVNQRFPSATIEKAVWLKFRVNLDDIAQPCQVLNISDAVCCLLLMTKMNQVLTAISVRHVLKEEVRLFGDSFCRTVWGTCLSLILLELFFFAWPRSS